MFYLKKSLKSYLLIILATFFLYLWQLHLYPMINSDGVTYIEAAAAYLKGGVSSAVALNYQAKWPFYSILIASVHQLTSVSLINAERILDVIFIMMSACFFLYYARLFSQHKNATVWAMIIWLTWHAYVLWWPAIVRDHGFLVCLLVSLFCYHQYVLTRNFFWAFAWSSCLILGEFFRIESMVYLMFLPFSVFFLKAVDIKRKFIFWLQLSILPLCVIASVAMLFVSHVLSLHSLRFAYIWKEFSLFFSVIAHNFMQSYTIMHEKIFFRENNFSVYALLISYLIVFLSYIVAQISVAILLPLWFTRKIFYKLSAEFLNRSFLPYLGVAIFIPFCFFAEHLFLNMRYLLPLGFLLLLLATSALPHIIDAFSQKKKIIFLSLFAVLLAFNFINNIFLLRNDPPDSMVVGKWIKKHYPNDKLFTNDRQILFYASSPPDYKHGELQPMKWDGIGDVWLQNHDDWCNFDLLVITARPGKSIALENMFAQFQKDGMIGAIIKRYRRLSDREKVLIAPIISDTCLVKLRNVTDNI